jgi:hypothetical protein
MKQHNKKRTHMPFYNTQVVASVSRGAGVGTWLVSWSPTKKSASMTRYSGASTRCRRMRSRNTRLARHKTLKGHTNTSSQIWKGAQGDEVTLETRSSQNRVVNCASILIAVTFELIVQAAIASFRAPTDPQTVDWASRLQNAELRACTRLQGTPQALAEIFGE